MSSTDWRNQYQASQESLRINQEKTRRATNQLLRDLTRISIAANGLDYELDQLLEKLRKEIRTNADLDEVHRICETFSHRLKSCEAEHSSYYHQALQMLNDCIDTLTTLKIPRPLKNKITTLSKNIAQPKADHTREALLAGFTLIMREYQQFIKDQGKNIKQRSLWEALFSTKSSDTPPPSPPSPSPSSPSNLQPPIENPKTIVEQTVQAIKQSSYQQAPNELLQPIKSLALQLQVPKAYELQHQTILQQLETALTLSDLTKLLEDLVHLVGITLAGEKGKQEEFLNHLSTRLQALDHFLKSNAQLQQSQLTANIALEQSVRKNVSDIRQSITEATSLEEIQQSIDNHLGHIITTLNNYKAQGENELQKALAQTKSLQAELTATQKNAQDLQKALQRERSTANIDPLTGIANRKAYDEHLSDCFENWQMTHQHLTLIIADVDNFKQINDSFGHSTGDDVLRVIGTILKNNVRKTDFVARYGGEEFAIILNGANLEHGLQVAEKLRAILEAWKFTYQDHVIPITMSFGVAMFADNDDDDSFFRRADTALYKAKQSGRNQVASEQDLD